MLKSEITVVLQRLLQILADADRQIENGGIMPGSDIAGQIDHAVTGLTCFMLDNGVPLEPHADAMQTLRKIAMGLA